MRYLFVGLVSIFLVGCTSINGSGNNSNQSYSLSSPINAKKERASRAYRAPHELTPQERYMKKFK